MSRPPDPVELDGQLVRPYIRAGERPKATADTVQYVSALIPLDGLRGLIVFRHIPRNGDHK